MTETEKDAATTEKDVAAEKAEKLLRQRVKAVRDLVTTLAEEFAEEIEPSHERGKEESQNAQESSRAVETWAECLKNGDPLLDSYHKEETRIEDDKKKATDFFLKTRFRTLDKQCLAHEENLDASSDRFVQSLEETQTYLSDQEDFLLEALEQFERDIENIGTSDNPLGPTAEARKSITVGRYRQSRRRRAQKLSFKEKIITAWRILRGKPTD